MVQPRNKVPRLILVCQTEDQCLFKRVFFFRLAQLKIDYGWRSMAPIYNRTIHTNFEPCKPEIKNYPLLKTLVPQPNSCGSGLGIQSRSSLTPPPSPLEVGETFPLVQPRIRGLTPPRLPRKLRPPHLVISEPG